MLGRELGKDVSFVHMDTPEIRTEQGKAYLFVVLDRATKYVYGEI